MKFSKDNVSDYEEILSTQEEADIRIILQSMFVNQQMVKVNFLPRHAVFVLRQVVSTECFQNLSPTQ
jgi:hypothetical protein